jgi:thiol:disulfide interchange protein DsbD
MSLIKWLLASLGMIQVMLISNSFAQKSSEPLNARIQLNPPELQSQQMAQMTLLLEVSDEFKVFFDNLILAPPKNLDLKISKLRTTQALRTFDKFTKKDREILTGAAQVFATIELPEFDNDQDLKTSFLLTYQACTEKFCLFPKTIEVPATLKIRLEPNPSKIKLPQLKVLGFALPVTDNLILVLLITFFMGLLTSFTPCVFPMIPITMAVLNRESHVQSKWSAFLTANTYVLGVACMFSSLGLLAAASGRLFGSYINHPAVLVIICIVLLAMILSLLGFLEFKAPEKIQKYFASPHAGYGGVFLAGIGAGVIASPCVGPIIVSILTFVATTQDYRLGFLLLFVYALGFGQLFLFLGVSSSFLRRLPKSGAWLNTVKYLIAAFLSLTLFHYASLLFSPWLSNQETFFDEHAVVSNPNWEKFSVEKLSLAAKEKKLVVVDFFADWCAACVQLEKQSFSDPKVIDYSRNFVMLKYDATNPSKELTELQKKYGIVGLPTILFFAADGSLIEELTLTEFEPSEALLKRMEKALKKQP